MSRYRNETLQAERQRIIRAASTMFEQAKADVGAELGGRFRDQAQIIGNGPIAYPGAAGWTRDPVPPEPPLGIDINKAPSSE